MTPVPTAPAVVFENRFPSFATRSDDSGATAHTAGTAAGTRMVLEGEHSSACVPFSATGDQAVHVPYVAAWHQAAA